MVIFLATRLKSVEKKKQKQEKQELENSICLTDQSVICRVLAPSFSIGAVCRVPQHWGDKKQDGVEW